MFLPNITTRPTTNHKKPKSITHVISQTDVLSFLLRHADRLGAVANATLEQLGLAVKRVVCVPEDMPTINALATMVVSGVVVWCCVVVWLLVVWGVCACGFVCGECVVLCVAVVVWAGCVVVLIQEGGCSVVCACRRHQSCIQRTRGTAKSTWKHAVLLAALQ